VSGFRFIEEAPIDGLERDVGPGATIGRAECEVELNDPDVSRRHAVLRQVDGGLGIEDLGSKNGTFVNDRRVSGIVPVGAGDRVRFGNTVWRLAPEPPGS
jgi:pSer/pThr/pTyr-binding forkhead associated (FHA) protein